MQGMVQSLGKFFVRIADLASASQTCNDVTHTFFSWGVSYAWAAVPHYAPLNMDTLQFN
jgi:hypothetical protein